MFSRTNLSWCRYNAERLSMGLGMTAPLGPREWSLPIRSGYDPQMSRYVARVPGGVMGSEGGRYDNLLRRIDAREFGGYRDGVDQGVVQLGNTLERGLHDWGHMRLSLMVATRGRGQAAIGTTSGSARDPVFYRWHALVEGIFTRYKETLGPYNAGDLAFPGVAVAGAALRQQGRPDNSLETSIETREVEVASLNRPTRADPGRGGQAIRLRYRSMAHQPLTLEVVVRAEAATPAVLRAFLVHPSQPSVVLTLDHWVVHLSQGDNTITR